jgi:type II secretory pathway pseudopilin PulG
MSPKVSRRLSRRSTAVGNSRARRGFTLIELMASLTGGLVLAVAVFLLSKHSSELYQRETRVATANLASVVGFERLRADIGRAGFMTSPNVRRDPFVCGSPVTGSWPALLGKMSSIWIENTPSTSLPALFANNGIAPQRITMAGNYSSAEAFPIRAVNPSGTAFTVSLQVATGPMSRIGYNDAGANQLAILESVFPPGRAVRIVDKSGRHHYATLQSVAITPGPTLTLKAGSPDLVFRADSSSGCGLKGEETGAMINTVNFIRYELKSLSSNDAYKPIYATDGPFYDADRTELVREELDPTGAAIAGTQELVAEYAVDLRFRVTAAPSQRSALQYVPAASLAQWVGDPSTLALGKGPQLVREVHSWLSIRSREADRNSGVTQTTDGPLFRVALGSDGVGPYARVRTVQARVALQNQMGVTWQ